MRKYLKLLFISFIIFVNCTPFASKDKLSSGHNYKIIENRNGNSVSNKMIFLSLEENYNFLPTSTTGQIINHDYYTVSYSEKDEQPEWVAYKIISNNYNKSIERTNDYREDPFVTTKSASPNDYHGSGYDMGHLAPARDMTNNNTSMSESFYLSNICPQKASFNRGIWRVLEGKVHYWSTFNDSIYVVSGPILDHPIEQIGENKVTVPRAFYKTLLAFKKGKMKAIAFIIPNEKSDKSIYSYATSIDEVEAKTGINFYYNLDKVIQDSLEVKKDLKSWISIK